MKAGAKGRIKSACRLKKSGGAHQKGSFDKGWGGRWWCKVRGARERHGGGTTFFKLYLGRRKKVRSV